MLYHYPIIIDKGFSLFREGVDRYYRFLHNLLIGEMVFIVVLVEFAILLRRRLGSIFMGMVDPGLCFYCGDGGDSGLDLYPRIRSRPDSGSFWKRIETG